MIVPMFPPCFRLRGETHWVRKPPGVSNTGSESLEDIQDGERIKTAYINREDVKTRPQQMEVFK
jgi:hypothetical protein